MVNHARPTLPYWPVRFILINTIKTENKMNKNGELQTIDFKLDYTEP